MHRDTILKPSSGWTMLTINLIALVAAIVLVITGGTLIEHGGSTGGVLGVVLIVPAVLLGLAALVSLRGHFIVQPNHSRVLVLFGTYRGTVRDAGFYWANPFLTRIVVSLRLRNLEGAHLKVNDKRGNPLEIAAVVVWRVRDAAQASFDVDDYQLFVKVQSETAVRHLASEYAYDHGDGEEQTLLNHIDGVSIALQVELQARLASAGVDIAEARLTHLAYAPEIAGAMLRRQQAEAIIAARQKIVHGAVSMVQMALDELATKNVIALDEERKATMVSNLLVVLCADHDVQPVINTGTLYQ